MIITEKHSTQFSLEPTGYCRIEYSVNDDPASAVLPFKVDTGGASGNIAKVRYKIGPIGCIIVLS